MQVTIMEHELFRSILTRHIVPLSQHISDMAQSKFKCWDAIKTNIGSYDGHGVNVSSMHKLYPIESELWVQTKDGMIRGKIDSILQNNISTYLLEYKIGKILENQDPSDTVAMIRPDYLVQVYLYAALFP